MQVFTPDGPVGRDSEYSGFRVVDTKELLRLNDAAINAGYNRTLDPDALVKMVDIDGRHVVAPLLIHENKGGVRTDPHMRCSVMIKTTGSMTPFTAFLDIDLDAFNKLPRAGGETSDASE